MMIYRSTQKNIPIFLLIITKKKSNILDKTLKKLFVLLIILRNDHYFRVQFIIIIVTDHKFIQIDRIMYQDKSISELSVKTLKQRQISQWYLKLEEHTECLTHILRYKHRNLKHNLPLSALNFAYCRSLYKIIVQLSYLLYMCHLKKINILISNEFYLVPCQRPIGVQEVYLEYMIEMDFHRFSQKQQVQLGKKMQLLDIKSQNNRYGQFIFEFIQKIRKILHFALQTMQNIHARQLISLISIMEVYLGPQLMKLSPKSILLSFQQSQLFRQNSLLIKCFNSSLFSAIKFHPEHKRIIKELIQIDKGIQKRIMQQRPKNYQLIFQSLEQSFKVLIKNSIIAFSSSLGQDLEEKQCQLSDEYDFRLGCVEETQDFNIQSIYKIRIFIKQKRLNIFSLKILENIFKKIQNPNQIDPQSHESPENKNLNAQSALPEYLISYSSFNNLLTIKCLTNIKLFIDNTDVFTLHFNHLTETHHELTIQFISQQTLNNEYEETFLTFKITTFLCLNEMFIFKVLDIIDLLTSFRKVWQPQFQKHIWNIDEFYDRNIQISKIFEQIKRLFNDKLYKCYEMMCKN